jgi:hypothetical protein
MCTKILTIAHPQGGGGPGFVWCESAFVCNSMDGEIPSALRPCRPPSLSFSERKTRSGLVTVLFTFLQTTNHRKFVVLIFAKQVFYLPTVGFFCLCFRRFLHRSIFVSFSFGSGVNSKEKHKAASFSMGGEIHITRGNVNELFGDSCAAV